MKTIKFRGFTLIELLVVIAIIAILASIILASLNQARTKSRDARRAADIKTLQTALELYNNDNGGYPVQSTAGDVSGVVAALVPTYISALPQDPQPSYSYWYQSLASSATASAACGTAPCASYVLRAELENNNASLLTGSVTGTVAGVDCSQSPLYYYCVRP